MTFLQKEFFSVWHTCSRRPSLYEAGVEIQLKKGRDWHLYTKKSPETYCDTNTFPDHTAIIQRYSMSSGWGEWNYFPVFLLRDSVWLRQQDKPSSFPRPVTAACFWISPNPPHHTPQPTTVACLLHSLYCLWFLLGSSITHQLPRWCRVESVTREASALFAATVLLRHRTACSAPISHSQVEQSPHISCSPHHELVTAKSEQDASWSVVIYQGQPHAVQNHTVAPECDLVLRYLASLMNQVYAITQTWYLCVLPYILTWHTHTQTSASICGYVNVDC